MTKKPPAVLQIGKNRLTDSFIGNMIPMFKERENMKINVLKAAGHTQKNVKEIADSVVERLKEAYEGKDFTYRIVGFTIFLKKWRKLQNPNS